MYSETLMRHFLRPSNVGEMADADGVGRIGDPDCGDYMLCWIKVRDERIEAVTFQCHGCPAAIATGSVMTELARGLALDEVGERITEASIAAALGGMPEVKLHCSNLGAGALQAAVLDFRGRRERETVEEGDEGGIRSRLLRHFRLLVELLGATGEEIAVAPRLLSADEEKAHEGDGTLVPVRGRPRLVEARFREGCGQIRADSWQPFRGTVEELGALSQDTPEGRATFLAGLNALAAEAGIARGHRLCDGDGARHCALEAKFRIMKKHRGVAVLIGWHRHLAGLLADFPGSRIVVADEAKVGQRVGRLEVWGPERRAEALDGGHLLWLGDEVLVDGSLDAILAHPAEKIFWGPGSAAAAALCGWKRFCPYGR